MHCEKNNTTSPNLGKLLPFFGTEVRHKLNLNQSNNNLGVPLTMLVRKRHIMAQFYQELEGCTHYVSKVIPRIGRFCDLNPLFSLVLILVES